MADFIKMGNIISPNGASVIFGSESTEDNKNIEIVNSETYMPYDIVIVEEDIDETLPAEQISFAPDLDNSQITTTDVQHALLELEQIVYQTVPTFTQQVMVASGGETSFKLNTDFPVNLIMVYYNGLLINLDQHFSYENRRINLLDFVAEEGDTLTVISLAGSNMIGTNVDASALIGGSY